MAEEAITEQDLYFQMHGLTAQPPNELNAALTDAISQMQRTLYGESAGELTVAEIEVLEECGMDLKEHPDQPDPLMRTTTEFAALLSTSLAPSAAAKRLRCHVTRIRQMIREHKLYAIQIDGRWRIPEFQFQGNRLIPNIGAVNAALNWEQHPLSILHWYALPEPDLETDNGQTMTPLAWLKAGNPVEPVVAAAAGVRLQ